MSRIVEKFIAEAEVSTVTELKTQEHVSGLGKDAVFNYKLVGHVITLSNHMSFMTTEKPGVEPGQKARITLEVETNAKP